VRRRLTPHTPEMSITPSYTRKERSGVEKQWLEMIVQKIYLKTSGIENNRMRVLEKKPQ
jgi:hypothetical protein